MTNKKPSPTRPIKIGFDFDGVIMYNPLRIFRSIANSIISRNHSKKSDPRFFIPKTKLEKFIWWLIHQSSLYPANGISSIRKLVEDGVIEAYLITGRPTCLKEDFYFKLKMYKLLNIFKTVHITDNNEQSHTFKQTEINKLGLDYFIEDNLDIVSYLRKVYKGQNTKILWITNIIDRRTSAINGHLDVGQAVKHLIKS
jgi:hypothetical protein